MQGPDGHLKQGEGRIIRHSDHTLVVEKHRATGSTQVENVRYDTHWRASMTRWWYGGAVSTLWLRSRLGSLVWAVRGAAELGRLDIAGLGVSFLPAEASRDFVREHALVSAGIDRDRGKVIGFAAVAEVVDATGPDDWGGRDLLASRAVIESSRLDLRITAVQAIANRRIVRAGGRTAGIPPEGDFVEVTQLGCHDTGTRPEPCRCGRHCLCARNVS